MKNLNIPNWLTFILLLIAAFLFVFLFSCTTSPLYEHYPFWFHGDSGIFQEMGVCLLQGGTPYVDLFDHKGPILWFIQALGIWISPQWGLTLLQTIALFCTLILWYKSSFLLVEKQIPAIIITFAGLIFLLAFYQRGNLCEEWCLPFISLPIYIYVKRWKQSVGTHEQNCQWPFCSPATIASPQASKAPQELQILPAYQHSDAFIMGLCVGIIAMIRLNNTAPIVGFALWHFIGCIRNKDYRRLWTDIALIVTGIVIVFIVCASFYLAKAGWTGVYEMIYGTFIFNFLYMHSVGISYPLYARLLFYSTPVGFLLITIIYLSRNHHSASICIPSIISYIFTFLALGHHGYYHYLMFVVPLYIVSLCLLFKSRSIVNLTLLVLLFLSCINKCYESLDLLVYRFTKEPPLSSIRQKKFHQFISSMPNEEKKSIYSYDVLYGQGILAIENTTQCNRILNSNHANISPRLNEYQKKHGIKDINPVWIITQSPRPEAVNDYMSTHYTLADSIPCGEFDPIWCWRKICDNN